MAIPVYLWLKDDGGVGIEGSVDVKDREGSLEVVAQEHNLYIPTDNNIGKCINTSFLLTRKIDSSNPYLYKAVTTGQTLKSAKFKWYKINDASLSSAAEAAGALVSDINTQISLVNRVGAGSTTKAWKNFSVKIQYEN